MVNCKMVLARLEELSRLSFYSSSNRSEIEEFYPLVLGRSFVHTSCNDCYHDAVIEMYLYLKKYGKMKEKSQYSLKNGVLLQFGFGSSEMYTNANLTDEIAERYLAACPQDIKLFSGYPKDWKERINTRMSQVDQNLVVQMAEKLKEGDSAQAVIESFKDYKSNGKKATKKLLTIHVNKALELLAGETEDENAVDNNH